MEFEVTRMLTQVIIRVSTSPRLAQAFVGRDGLKPRMMIIRQLAIKRPGMPKFDQAAKNTIFFKNRFEMCVSSIPTPSQGHAIHCVRTIRTRFRVHQTSLSLGHKCRNGISTRNDSLCALKQMHPYVDDVIIGGRI